jgi:hypothetical protein
VTSALPAPPPGFALPDDVLPRLAAELVDAHLRLDAAQPMRPHQSPAALVAGRRGTDSRNAGAAPGAGGAGAPWMGR